MHHGHVEVVGGRSGGALPRAIPLITLASYLNIRVLQQRRIRSHTLQVEFLGFDDHWCLNVLVYSAP